MKFGALVVLVQTSSTVILNENCLARVFPCAFCFQFFHETELDSCIINVVSRTVCLFCGQTLS